jgi:hypothetical protein
MAEGAFALGFCVGAFLEVQNKAGGQKDQFRFASEAIL